MKRRSLRWFILLLCFLTLVSGCGGGSGDRVLVAKYWYDSGIADPERFDVVVFRYPREPVKGGVATNYIKRLIGLAGETIAIFFGQLFSYDGLANHYKEDLDAARVRPTDLWTRQYMHSEDPLPLELFQEGKFKIVRKPPAVMLALRRIVFDNDFPPQDTAGILPPRWQPTPGGSWTVAGNAFQHSGKGTGKDWLRYQHILRPDDWPQSNDPAAKAILDSIKQRQHRPQLITDISGYNSYEPRGLDESPLSNWVGDLMLECEVKVEQPQGKLLLELAKGIDRFQAELDLKEGICTLSRFKNGQAELLLGKATTGMNQSGTYNIRFANFDERLTIWVGGKVLPFKDKDGVDYERAWSYDKRQREFSNTGPTANDLKPASVASEGAVVAINHLKLWRNTYYTARLNATRSDADLPSLRDIPEGIRHDRIKRAAYEADYWSSFWGTPAEWAPLRRLPMAHMFVQPGHYLCLGDNSPESSDSREWGTVPQRLLLGRAIAVYWPLPRVGVIK